MLRASSSAVPLGTSSFWLWWRSTISMSALGNIAAAFFARSASSATPRDMFPDRNTGTSFAAASIRASSSSVWPVVPITTGSRCSTQYSVTAWVAAWLEKSITMSARPSYWFSSE